MLLVAAVAALALVAVAWSCCATRAEPRVTSGTREERRNWLLVWGDVDGVVEPVLCYAILLDGCVTGFDSYEGQTMRVELRGRANRVIGNVVVDMQSRVLHVDCLDVRDRTMQLGEGNVFRLHVDDEERLAAIGQDHLHLRTREEVDRVIPF